jgi:hypothetical protein
MVGDGCECSIAVPGCFRRRFRRLRVRFEHLDLLIRAARYQLPISRPAHALDYVLMGGRLPKLFPAGEVPYFDDTVTTPRCKVLEGVGVLREGVDTVDMSGFETAEEGLREHALDFGRIEGSRVLSRALKGVSVHAVSMLSHSSSDMRCSQIRVQIPRLFCDCRTRSLCRSR